MSKVLKSGKRSISFWKSETPLTSKRVSRILSNPKSSSDLAESVRKVRHSSHVENKSKLSFKVNKLVKS